MKKENDDLTIKEVCERTWSDARYSVLVFATRKFLTFENKDEAIKLKAQLNALGFQAEMYSSSTANLGVY